MKRLKMISKETYMANPCGTSSLPFWKEKQIVVPDNMLVLHDKNFSKSYLVEYNDEPYFRLKHNLIEVNQPVLPSRAKVIMDWLIEKEYLK